MELSKEEGKGFSSKYKVTTSSVFSEAWEEPTQDAI